MITDQQNNATKFKISVMSQVYEVNDFVRLSTGIHVAMSDSLLQACSPCFRSLTSRIFSNTGLLCISPSYDQKSSVFVEDINMSLNSTWTGVRKGEEQSALTE